MKKLILISALLIINGCATLGSDLQIFWDPSDEIIKARMEGLNDVDICSLYFNRLQGAARSEEHRYRHYVLMLNEINNRNLDCKSFPEYSDREEWMEDWVREYEESLNQ